jgi:hypothetical protein
MVVRDRCIPLGCVATEVRIRSQAGKEPVMTSPTPDGGTPAVRRQPPPALLLTVFNPIFSAILRSPVHRVADGSFMVLHLTGRKTGKRYSIVVGRHELEGGLSVLTGSPWRVNVRGGADVQITDRGVTRPARAVLVEEPGEVAAVYAAEIERLGRKGAQRALGLKINVERAPTRAELEDVVRRDHLSVIRIQPA